MRNEVTLVGFVGSDPIIRYYNKSNGKDSIVVNFSLCTTKRVTNRKTGEVFEDKQWHNISAWDHNAKYIEKYVVKGSKLTVWGELKYSKYTDKEDIERIKAFVQVESAEIGIGKIKQRVISNEGNEAVVPNNELDSNFNEDDLPF